MLLGWAPKDNRELFTLNEFVQAFDPNGLQKANPMFLPAKLNWFNGHYIRQKTDTELTQLMKPYMKNKITDTKLTQIIPLIKDRLVKLSDFDNLTYFFFAPPKYNSKLWMDTSLSLSQLTDSLPVLEKTEWSETEIESNLRNLINLKRWKIGDYFMSLRIAICGSRSTPPITETMLVISKEESLTRIKNAINVLSDIEH
jgi:glutamyl-tRNA synthetase